MIALTDGTSSSADVHDVASASTTTLSFREESFSTETLHRRLVVRVDAADTQTIWVGVHAHVSDRAGFAMGPDAGDPDVLRMTYGTDEKLFRIDASDHGLVRTTISAPPTTAPPTTQPPSPTAPMAGLDMDPVDRYMRLVVSEMSSNAAEFLLCRRSSTRW